MLATAAVEENKNCNIDLVCEGQIVVKEYIYGGWVHLVLDIQRRKTYLGDWEKENVLFCFQQN